MVQDISVLIGGRAGEGINNAGMMIAHLMNHLGYFVYMYYDYPSLIRGGHNFALVRISDQPVGVHRETADFVLALNQETIARHAKKFHSTTSVIYDSDAVKADGQGLSVKNILAAENAPAIMGNSAVLGAFAKASGIPWETVTAVFARHLQRGTEKNLAVARRGYDKVSTVQTISPVIGNAPRSLMTGNEAIGLGLIAGGLESYISYPMTPSSSLLHFLAEHAERFGVSVIHPENEIAVMLMALGCSYAGNRAAVGTSGGGFCLMTEGLSLAGMAEIPVVILVAQRTGPSTGLPTYTAQSDLRFVLHAGQGEYPRLVVAPGDLEQAYTWSAIAMDMAWRFQVPAFILSDKTLSEGFTGVNLRINSPQKSSGPSMWDGKGSYERYQETDTGVSPFAFPGTEGAVVKANGYAHDTAGITTEDAAIVGRMTRKRLLKGKKLSETVFNLSTVNVQGPPGAATSVICWGSVLGPCSEVCRLRGIRLVQPVVLAPFPADAIKKALAGTRTLIAVEENSTGQLAGLLREAGIPVDRQVLHCDGRPITPDALASRLEEVT